MHRTTHTSKTHKHQTPRITHAHNNIMKSTTSSIVMACVLALHTTCADALSLPFLATRRLTGDSTCPDSPPSGTLPLSVCTACCGADMGCVSGCSITGIMCTCNAEVDAGFTWPWWLYAIVVLCGIFVLLAIVGRFYREKEAAAVMRPMPPGMPASVAQQKMSMGVPPVPVAVGQWAVPQQQAAVGSISAGPTAAPVVQPLPQV